MGHAPSFAFESPEAAIDALLARFSPLGTETVPLERAGGRVLAAAAVADRPSPPCDVSAMDGYVLRLADLTAAELPVAGEVRTGHPPDELPPGAAMRVFTGGAVPAAGEAVIPREQLTEEPDRILLPADLNVRPGQHIRRRGENLETGAEVAAAGEGITPPMVSALASFGYAEVSVHRKVRVSVLVTGDELVPFADRPGRTQIRDSNGPALAAFLDHPWIDVCDQAHAVDDPARMAEMLRARLTESDAILMSGGVSMGDHDYVVEVLRRVGAKVIFHRLPIRPGKPLLAAEGPGGQLVLGLPGNPVSVLATARRFGLPALRMLAGMSLPAPHPEIVAIGRPDDATLGLFWHRLVRREGPGRVELVSNRGSGDVAGLARSDGFVCVKPNRLTEGSLPYFGWMD